MSYSTLAHAMISYVECHLDNFSLSEMSKCFGFSEIYLRELFLKNFHTPIMQYYRKRRTIVSAFELLHSGKTIMDIALENGFSNHESYTRAFRRILGMSHSVTTVRSCTVSVKSNSVPTIAIPCFRSASKQCPNIWEMTSPMLSLWRQRARLSA